MKPSRNYGALLAQGLSEDDIADHPTVAGFSIIRKLGEGGMGSVYLAQDDSLKREVALKIFHVNTLDPMSLERIRQESEIMARAQHPNVLGIHNVISFQSAEANRPFCLVLEYAAGGDLAKKIRSEGALPLEATIDISLNICDGLSKIHQLGIIHRDIKPANILLTRSNIAKVADLGIAKDLEMETLTRTGSYLGSLMYVSPEQMTSTNTPVDHRADIWSMGILIYEMLTGSPPKAVLESELMEPLPASIRPIVTQCLKQNPDNRYQNIEQLKADLINVRTPQTPLTRIVVPPVVISKKSKFPLVLASLATLTVIGFAAYKYTSAKGDSDQSPSKNLPLPISAVEKTPVETPEKIKKTTPTPTPTPTSEEPEEPEKPTKIIDNKSIKLLDLLSDPLQPDTGIWTLSSTGKLTCKKGKRTAIISFPVRELGDEYDLSFKVVRNHGLYSMGVFLPTSIGTLTFDLDAWGRNLAGIQSLDRRNLKQRDDSIKFTMTNKQTYQIGIKVRKEFISVNVDGKQIYTCNILGKKASIISEWDLPRKHDLSIGAYYSAMTFSDLILKKIP